MEYRSTSRFLRLLKKYPIVVQEDVLQALARFEAGERESLGFHKLHGKFRMYHAFSANFSYRVVIKITRTVVYYVAVGTHDIYR